MKTLVLVLLFHFVAVPSSAQDNFRGSEWGASRAEVISKHGDPYFKQKHEDMPGLVYRASASGRDALAVFQFLPDSLVLAAGKYIFTNSLPSPSAYVRDFNDVGESLRELYGKPKLDSLQWREERYREEYDNYGRAIRDGNLEILQSWRTDDGIIFHKLSGTSKGEHTLRYVGKNYVVSYLAIVFEREYEGL